MSLEKALEANTAALLALNESMNRFIAGVVEAEARMRAAMPPALEQPAKKQEEKASAPSKAKLAPAAENPASTAAEPGAAASTSLSYDDIKTPFLDLAKRDLAAAQALIAEFGFKTLKDAKPEQYAEIKAKLDAMGEEGMA